MINKLLFNLCIAFLIMINFSCKETKKQSNQVVNPISLFPAPKSWGKPISGSSGKLVFNVDQPEQLNGKIQVEGLKANHFYTVTLNGKVEDKSNNLLPQTYGVERYVDITEFMTDSMGNVDSAFFKVFLSSGAYNVKFFIKDRDDWKIVLYNNYFVFYIK